MDHHLLLGLVGDRLPRILLEDRRGPLKVDKALLVDMRYPQGVGRVLGVQMEGRRNLQEVGTLVQEGSQQP